MLNAKKRQVSNADAFKGWILPDLEKKGRPRSCCKQGTGLCIRFLRYAKSPPREMKWNRPSIMRTSESERNRKSEAVQQRTS